MNALANELARDRATRDAALAVFRADLAFIREDLGARGIGSRISDRIGESAKDMLDDAVDYAEENRGMVAAAIAALVLWFARAPLLHALAQILGFDDGEEEPRNGDARSHDDD